MLRRPRPCLKPAPIHQARRLSSPTWPTPPPSAAESPSSPRVGPGGLSAFQGRREDAGNGPKAE